MKNLIPCTLFFFSLAFLSAPSLSHASDPAGAICSRLHELGSQVSQEVLITLGCNGPGNSSGSGVAGTPSSIDANTLTGVIDVGVTVLVSHTESEESTTGSTTFKAKPTYEYISEAQSSH